MVYKEVWISKVMAFVTACTSKGTTSRKDSAGEAQAAERELAFIRYFDRIRRTEEDCIDKLLGCVKLKWAERNLGSGQEPSEDLNTAYLDVLPVATIRGLVHVVRGDYELHRTQTFGCKGARPWREQWFYVNRFRHPRRALTFNTIGVELEK